ncbi:MAG: hypothetical protein Q8M65_01770 [Rhodoglobus sp.]|nr:hypothetical protein [Rhodoglobus sp.]
MTKLSLASVTLDDLSALARLESRDLDTSPWDASVEPLDDSTTEQLRYLATKLAATRSTTLNEATIWSRAIYPLLELAETDQVRAWAEVPLAARDPYSETEIAGIVDGVLAVEGVLAGAPGVPFLLVVEAKRGMDGVDPRPQLIGALLAVLWSELVRGGSDAAESFGCFTVGDIWTFVRAEARVGTAGGAGPRLGVTLSWSREYAERTEALVILRALRHIARRRSGSPTAR